MKGRNDMPREIRTVTGFLESNNEILIVKRSEQVSTYKGVWGGISGRIKDNYSPEEQARLEIAEETGLSKQDIQLIKQGEALVFEDTALKVKKTVYPFLFHIQDRSKIRLDWEHTEAAWIKPACIGNYSTMPKLKETLDMVLTS